ncbi:unnamed protein product [Arabis nemorensis]|uniref:Uncharacterized protein n=1 Tax=Arabis nemorensis TaxID=586526 RepID=A0A565BUT2_9BRAS|nr:unnamed protein product [Arabis nemorensis]
MDVGPGEPISNLRSQDGMVENQSNHEGGILIKPSSIPCEESSEHGQDVETIDPAPEESIVETRKVSEKSMLENYKPGDLHDEDEHAELEQKLQEPIILGSPIDSEQVEGTTRSYVGDIPD